LTVTNNGPTSDRLNCVSDDASAKCQIHTMTMENGVMKMRPMQGGLEINPGETVTLKPSGIHMMFLELKHPLEPGKTVEATLQFEKAGTARERLGTLRPRRRPKCPFIASHSACHERFVLQIDGRAKSGYRPLADALRAALRLKDQFPQHNVKVRARQTNNKSSQRLH
jgi:hypothetical protein